MATCPKCKLKVGKGNKRKLHNGTWVHKRCPGDPKVFIKKSKDQKKKYL